MNNDYTEPKDTTSWLTLEAAQYPKMGKSTYCGLARKRIIPAHKTGREWWFNVEEPDCWVKLDESKQKIKRTLK